jgi:glucokinase
MPMALRPVLALDLGGTHLRAALITPSGEVLRRSSRPTPRTADVLVQAAVDALAEAKVGADGPAEPPVAVGISAPGPLNPHAGRLIDPPNLHPSTWDLPLADLIADALDLPTTMDKDTNVAALGEGFFGAAVGSDNFVYLTISTGVGGAVVSGGRLLHGPDGVAGELGHLAIDAYDGPLCGCGARGHLEAIASGTGIANAANAAGLAVGYASAREVASLEATGNLTAAVIMARAREAVASAVVTVVDLFNPDLVIIGGGIAAAEGERLLGPARDAVAATAFKVQARRARIVAPMLGDDVSLVGALILANAALAQDVVAYGLQPRAWSPGRMALQNEPANEEDEIKRAVALG